MSQQKQAQMVGGNNQEQYNDTTFTKIFVGGLAWETQRDTMRRYFEQFGEILEAVVITDKNTGRSKGYGFVTFKDPEAAMRACQNPSPVIDGRRANCNLASLGANKNRPPTFQHGAGRFRPPPTSYHGSSSTATFSHQPPRQYTFPYSAYGYSGYSQDTLYPMNYYNVYGVQQFSAYYPSAGASGAVGLIHNIYPYYGQYAQSIQAQGFGVQYPQMPQFPFLPHPYGSTGILSYPSSVSVPTTTAVSVTGTATTTITPTTSTGMTATVAGSSQASQTASEQNSTSSKMQNMQG
ncbi:RNA-binding protein 24-B-like isoform X4 [Vigna unguiculata]|uniref:RNA-binding protein 24-B-like isoform X4 n=1 Tax=Vigna unguiculata TaxID=3917 RepID=UPI001016C124|nr:RNA-binding protein 24-B-like isoform X4 [Vigna unguiculata]